MRSFVICLLGISWSQRAHFLYFRGSSTAAKVPISSFLLELISGDVSKNVRKCVSAWCLSRCCRLAKYFPHVSHLNGFNVPSPSAIHKIQISIFKVEKKPLTKMCFPVIFKIHSWESLSTDVTFYIVLTRIIVGWNSSIIKVKGKGNPVNKGTSHPVINYKCYKKEKNKEREPYANVSVYGSWMLKDERISSHILHTDKGALHFHFLKIFQLIVA